MCFFKHLIVDTDIDKLFEKSYQEQSSQVQSQQIVPEPIPNFQGFAPIFNFSFSYSNKLQQLLRMIQANNSLIGDIQNKISEEQKKQPIEFHEVIEDNPQKVNKDELLCRLFQDLNINYGQSSFKYKLVLQENLPNKFYKHRKYVIGVKLMPSALRSTKVVLNSNPLNICIGVFDKDGNWVHQNLSQQPILEGITQVDLYQGRSTFPRILFNQISSNLPKQKLNIAIYVKPGLDQFRGGYDANPSVVSWKQVKPLILKNVIVLSKKRKTIQEDLL